MLIQLMIVSVVCVDLSKFLSQIESNDERSNFSLSATSQLNCWRCDPCPEPHDNSSSLVSAAPCTSSQTVCVVKLEKKYFRRFLIPFSHRKIRLKRLAVLHKFRKVVSAVVRRARPISLVKVRSSIVVTQIIVILQTFLDTQCSSFSALLE